MGYGPEQRRDGRASGPRACGASEHPTYEIEDVIGYDALWESMERCRRGVSWKASVQSFILNAPVEVARLCDELHSGTYRPRPIRTFQVTYPKRRDIVCISFRDRVVQRSYNDNVIYPCMSRSWIYDNYACQKGKGTDFARARMRAHLERQVRESGNDFSMLCVDVRGYYGHMLHEVIGERLYQKCPRWAARFACETIRGQYGGKSGVGINPGSQLAQIAGIDYLDEIDHHIKEQLRIHGYGRYMDDMVLVHSDADYLRECACDIGRMLSHVGLEAHPAKTRIVTANDGMTFLGFDYLVADDGHVVMTLTSSNVKAMRRRISRLGRLERDGIRPTGTTDDAYFGWRAHAEKGDSQRLLERCDRWYEEIRR